MSDDDYYDDEEDEEEEATDPEKEKEDNERLEKMTDEERKDYWDELIDTLQYFYPELFFTVMSPMYNNPEIHPGLYDEQAQKPNELDQELSVDQTEEKKPEVAPTSPTDNKPEEE